MRKTRGGVADAGAVDDVDEPTPWSIASDVLDQERPTAKVHTTASVIPSKRGWAPRSAPTPGET